MFRVTTPSIYWDNATNSYFFKGKKKNGYPFQWIDEAKFQVGETIFVKEKFAEVEIGAGFGYSTKKQILYRADDDYIVDWSPAQHMKQEHSRLTLRIKSVKVERLANISEEDCLREGIETFMNFGERAYIDYSKKHHALYNVRESFATLWNSTHKKPEEKWGANPFCFVYEYEVIKK